MNCEIDVIKWPLRVNFHMVNLVENPVIKLNCWTFLLTLAL